VAGAGVARDVGQRFLKNAEERDRLILADGERLAVDRQGEPQRDAAAEIGCVRLDRLDDSDLVDCLARALAPGMRARGGGVILHNASICATEPLGYEPIYNVTKAALVMFSKCLANELIGDNIRVNAVNPGLVMTGDWVKTAKLLTEGTDQTWEQYLQKIAEDNAPIGRFATPEEVADLFVYLCSDRASYSVGSTYYVDGGWLNVTT